MYPNLGVHCLRLEVVEVYLRGFPEVHMHHSQTAFTPEVLNTLGELDSLLYPYMNHWQRPVNLATFMKEWSFVGQCSLQCHPLSTSFPRRSAAPSEVTVKDPRRSPVRRARRVVVASIAVACGLVALLYATSDLVDHGCRW